MRWRRTGWLASVVMTAVLVSPLSADATFGGAAHGRAVPNGWVHHQETPWSWWTPRHWYDAHGPYDLNISSPTGADWVKYGFSAAPASYSMTPEQNADAFFSYWLSNYRAGSRNGPGLYSMALASVRYTSIGDTTSHPPTLAGYTNDYRKKVTFAGTRNDGVRIRGEMVMDYTESAYGDSGIESFQVRAAPRQSYADVIPMLRTIQHYIAYTGSLTN